MRSLLALALAASAMPAMAAGTLVFSTGQGEILPGTANQGAWNQGLAVQDTSTLTRSGFWFVPDLAAHNGLALVGLSEIRSFYTFDLRNPSLARAPVRSLALRLPNGSVNSALGQETLGFYDVSTPPVAVNTQGRLPPADLFADLGSGNLYATQLFKSATAPGTILTIDLGPQALVDFRAAAGRGYFTIGSRLMIDGPVDPVTGGGPLRAFPRVSFQGVNYVPSASLPLAELVAGVPEPETWAMMILGFGMIGSAMRRRRASERSGGPAMSPGGRRPMPDTVLGWTSAT